MRASRTIRKRLAAKRTREIEIAREIQIDTEGLVFDGARFPHWVSREIEIERLATDLALVKVSIPAEHVRVTAIPPGTTITERVIHNTHFKQPRPFW